MIEVATTTIHQPRRLRRYAPSERLERFLRSKYLERSDAAISCMPASAPSLASNYPATDAPRATGGDRGSGQTGLAHVLSRAAKLVAFALTQLLFGAIALESQAHAGEVLADSGVFFGQGAAKYSLNASGPGMLSVNLTDYQWTSPLADLTLEISSGTQILAEMTGAGQTTVSLIGPGTYYAYVMGDGIGPLGVGAYGLLGNFQALNQPTPVPLPASISLLLGGIAATLWSVRRNSRTGSDPGLVGASS